MTPGWKYRALRRATQWVVLLTLMVAPFLGGWQRLDRNLLASWDGHGWDLPAEMLDALPLGEAPGNAYAANQLMGGGAAMSLGGLAAADPVATTPALFFGPWSWRLALAWALPFVLALLFGRAFCGWLCPFGTLARGVDWVLERLPWRPPPIRLPARRPVRWAVLGGALLLAFLGTQAAIYAVLPHVLVHVSTYGLWLLGGGGAVLGWLLALFAVGVAFGPTTWCAAVCPTGAALSLGGRKRAFRIYIAEPDACGPHCDLCTRACWLQLDPASGDPGADCDTCARCFPICPKTNLRVGLATSAPPAKWTTLALLASLLVPGLADARPKPRLLLDGVERVGDVEVAFSAIDHTGTRLDADDPKTERGVEITVFVARGDYGAADPRGKLASREVYRGPLSVELRGAAGDRLAAHDFPTANTPRSTPRRRLYRIRFDVALAPGDRVVVAPIEGWLPEPVARVIPASSGAARGGVLRGFLVGLLFFGGLLATAAAFATGTRRP